jgi:hypothetical protein
MYGRALLDVAACGELMADEEGPTSTGIRLLVVLGLLAIAAAIACARLVIGDQPDFAVTVIPKPATVHPPGVPRLRSDPRGGGGSTTGWSSGSSPSPASSPVSR